MKEIVSVAVVGAGAIGASIAVRLMEAGKQVVISANGERKARYLKQGFVVNGRQYFLPVKDKYEADPADLVIIAVKNYSLEEAIEEMRPYVSVNTIILSLLNGIDAVPRLRREFGEDSVPYAMILGIDALREGNRVQYLAKGRIFCGFEKEKVEEVLGLDTTKYQVSVISPFGYRVNPQSKQLREPIENIVEYIK